MNQEFKEGDFVWIRGVDHKPFQYMVVKPHADAAPVSFGGMTLVARWYRNEQLTKIESSIEDKEGMS